MRSRESVSRLHGVPEHRTEYYILIMVNVVVCIGSNSGDRRWYITRMEKMLGDLFIPPVIRSRLMETEPVQVTDDQPWFLNRIISGRYNGSAFALLDSCKKIERALGRINKGMRTERTADIDILLFGNEEITTEELTIPHPALFSRRFCLEGLYQIMPDATIGKPARMVSEHYTAMTLQMRSQRLRFTDPEEGHSDD
jgi:2-amino-4-hydroxy-6-hydroxymethyldihydropteridine diphosphokinase